MKTTKIKIQSLSIHTDEWRSTAQTMTTNREHRDDRGNTDSNITKLFLKKKKKKIEEKKRRKRT